MLNILRSEIARVFSIAKYVRIVNIISSFGGFIVFFYKVCLRFCLARFLFLQMKYAALYAAVYDSLKTMRYEGKIGET